MSSLVTSYSTPTLSGNDIFDAMKSFKGYFSSAASTKTDGSSLTGTTMTDGYSKWVESINSVEQCPEGELICVDDEELEEFKKFLTNDKEEMERLKAGLALSPELDARRARLAKANAIAEAEAHIENPPTQEPSEAEINDWDAKADICWKKLLPYHLAADVACREFHYYLETYKQLRGEAEGRNRSSE